MRCSGRRLWAGEAMLGFKISEVKHFQGRQGPGCSHEWEAGIKVRGQREECCGVGHLHVHQGRPGRWQVLDGEKFPRHL